MFAASGVINRARSKAVGGKRDRCRKGKPCSATCISSWKQCLVDLSSSVQGSLIKLSGRLKNRIRERENRIKIFNKLTKELGDDKSIKIDKGPGFFVIRSLAGKHEIKVTVTYKSVSFQVDGSYNADKSIPRKTRFEIMSKVEKQFNAFAKSVGDGLHLEVTPWNDDGKGEKRMRAYSRAGFKLDGRYGLMYGVIRNGKIEPSTQSDFDNYQKRNEFPF